MKHTTENPENIEPTHERTSRQKERLRRDQEQRNRGGSNKNVLPEKNAPGLNEVERKDEMEDLYREEENRGTVEAA